MDQQQLKDQVVDHLAGLEYFSYRAMFGGYGLYQDTHIFGVIAGRVYFKTDAESRADYLAAGMSAWDQSKHYLEVPPTVLADPIALVVWAKRAAQVTIAEKAKKANKPKKTGR